MPYDGYSDSDLNNLIHEIRVLDTDHTETCFPKPAHDFNGAAWSTYSNLQKLTNCYTYALGRPDMGRAQPGNLLYNDDEIFAARDDVFIGVKDVQDRLDNDGLIMISEEEALSGNVHAIAMTVAEDDDFHFFLRDADGTWSDKAGTKAARQNPDITIPSKHAPNCRYQSFGGYYTIPKNGVEYTPRLALPTPVYSLF